MIPPEGSIWTVILEDTIFRAIEIKKFNFPYFMTQYLLRVSPYFTQLSSMFLYPLEGINDNLEPRAQGHYIRHVGCALPRSQDPITEVRE